MLLRALIRFFNPLSFRFCFRYAFAMLSVWPRFALLCFVLPSLTFAGFRSAWSSLPYSEADPMSPGTDKDVDYYQHKSTVADNFMPWRTGWEAASDNKQVRREGMPKGGRKGRPISCACLITIISGTCLVTIISGTVWCFVYIIDASAASVMLTVVRPRLIDAPEFRAPRHRFICVSFVSQLIKGFNPPPTVTPVPSEGYLCPPGQEYNSLEWELARWVVDNKVGVRLHGTVSVSVFVPVSVSASVSVLAKPSVFYQFVENHG